jgi:hypothetical protein
MQALDLLQKKSNDVFGKARFLYITEAYQLLDRYKNDRERLLIGWLADRKGNTPIPIYSLGLLVTYAPTRICKGTSHIYYGFTSLTHALIATSQPLSLYWLRASVLPKAKPVTLVTALTKVTATIHSGGLPAILDILQKKPSDVFGILRQNIYHSNPLLGIGQKHIQGNRHHKNTDRDSSGWHRKRQR